MDRNIGYYYDGSFEGLLCCVFDSFYRREDPPFILPFGEGQLTLGGSRDVETDLSHARRVRQSIERKISPDAAKLVYVTFLSALEERELWILRFLRMGYKIGRNVTRMLDDETVSVLSRACKGVFREMEKYTGFVRFSDVNGGLVGEIEPKSFILPMLRGGFASRYPDDTVLLYDKTHGAMLWLEHGHGRIVRVEDFQLPEADADERGFRQLWRMFYKTIAVEGRENERCRRTLMPKRYWGCLTEFTEQDERIVPRSLASGAAAVLPPQPPSIEAASL